MNLKICVFRQATTSFLSWVDISVGKIVAQFPTRLGNCSVMAHNPWNAVIALGE